MISGMPSFHDNLPLSQELGHQETAAALFTTRVLEHGLKEVKADSWATAAQTLEPLGSPIHRTSASGHEAALFERNGALVHAALSSGWIQVQAAADRLEAAERTISEMKELFAPPDPMSTQTVPVTFWTYGPHGPMASSRSISVPQWADIEANYAAGPREQLDELMRRFEPAHGGQLVLWHGRIGTGKTFALRALAWEWRNWCELHYIVDPDSFFGEHADYLMSVLTQPGYAEFADPRFGPMLRKRDVLGTSVASVEYGEAFDDEEEDEGGKAWRLLVLEDTGELLTPDAKAVIGQGLSRFLNVVDGLIGQGLRVLVLVTTNEEIKTLHPAVARPGRCAANVEFTPLSREEAATWLEERGAQKSVDGSATIASLFALLEGREGQTETPAGFAG
jgi:Domain of unknown function (DUF5925)/ATPase family associated with various cellular activities (AAA)